jgi:hypothetical protein
LNCTCSILMMKIHKINSLGVKKIPAVPVPDRPYFFCRPYYFFNAIDRATLFSPGGCGLLPNGVCCHTNYWKNHEKNIQKKIISDLPTLIFSRYETGTTGIFFTPYCKWQLMCPSWCILLYYFTPDNYY